MNSINWRFYLRSSVILASIVSSGINITPAQALSWTRTLDPSNDSYDINGTNAYELYAGGFAQDNDWAYFAFDTNLSVNGLDTGTNVGGDYVPDGNIGWGDFFLDFNPSGSLGAASNNGSLMGVKFSPNNDSKVVTQGLYGNVRGASVQRENAGSSDFLSFEYTAGYVQQLGDKNPKTDPYYSSVYDLTPPVRVPNVIGSGNFISSTLGLNRADLDLLGFSTTGHNSFGFKIDKSSLPLGQFVGTLLAECLNEGFSLTAMITEPEPPAPTPPEPPVPTPPEPPVPTPPEPPVPNSPVSDPITEIDTDVVPTPAAVLPILSGIFAAARRKKQTDQSE